MIGKRKLYRTTISPILFYESKCWTTKKQHIYNMIVIKMRMHIWMSGNILKDQTKS